jgi:competence protein ComEA
MARHQQQPQQSLDKEYGPLKQHIAQQATTPLPAVEPVSPTTTSLLSDVSAEGEKTQEPRKRWQDKRILAIALSVLLTLILFFTWRTFSPATNSRIVSPQTFTTISAKPTINPQANTSTTAPPTENHGSDIQVYIVGAIKHPGVYTLPASARMYQLIQAAGGPQANANLIAVNLAAKLSDGQEIYVPAIGESPPTTTGSTSATTAPTTSTQQKVNINTAGNDELRQSLHIASTTAQNIINYRQEHGNFTSIDQLLQAVSKSIYDKIKDQVSLS